MTEVLIKIPDGLDLNRVNFFLQEEIARLDRKAQLRAEYARVCAGDWPESFVTGPVVKAGVYQGERIPVQCEIYNWSIRDDNPNRPVVMKGALENLIMKYSRSSPNCPNGYAYKLIKRYIKFIKLTCYDWNEWNEFEDYIYDKIIRKFGYLMHFKLKYAIGYGYSSKHVYCIVGGYNVAIPHENYNFIQKLRGIVAKTDKIENRVAALRELRKKQQEERDNAK